MIDAWPRQPQSPVLEELMSRLPVVAGEHAVRPYQNRVMCERLHLTRRGEP